MLRRVAKFAVDGLGALVKHDIAGGEPVPPLAGVKEGDDGNVSRGVEPIRGGSGGIGITWCDTDGFPLSLERPKGGPRHDRAGGG